MSFICHYLPSSYKMENSLAFIKVTPHLSGVPSLFLWPWSPLCKHEGVQGYEPKLFSTYRLCDDRVPRCKSPWHLFGGLRWHPWWILPTLMASAGPAWSWWTDQCACPVQMHPCALMHTNVHTHVNFAHHRTSRFVLESTWCRKISFAMWTILSVSTTVFVRDSLIWL